MLYKYRILISLVPVCLADGQEHSAFRNGCLEKMRQIHAGMQTHNEKQISQPKHQPHPHMGSHISSEMCSQRQLEDCSQLLMAQLIELQEVQASAVLSALTDQVSACRHSVRSKDSTLTRGVFYLTLRAHIASKLCGMSINLNFRRLAAPTRSNS